MAGRISTEERLRQLAEIGRSLIEGSLEQRLTAVIERAPRVLGVESASIFLVEADFAHFGSRLALPGVEFIQESPRPDGITATVLRTGRLLSIEEVSAHPEIHPRVIEAGIRSFIAVPLKSSTRSLGVLYLNQHEPHKFSSRDLRLAEAIGDMTGQAVENARLQESELEVRRTLERERQHLLSLAEALDRSLTEADLLRAVNAAVAAAENLEQLLQLTFDRLRVLLAFSGGTLLLRVGEQLEVAATSGRQSGRHAGQRLRRSQQPIWRVVESGEPLIETRPGQVWALLAPLRWRNEVFGVLEAVSEHQLDVPQLNLLRKVADEIAGAAYPLAGRSS